VAAGLILGGIGTNTGGSVGLSRQCRTVQWGRGSFGRAEPLHAEVAETERRKGFTDHVGWKRLRTAQLDHHTTKEIDPEV
jgi:hypothetical protein